MGCATLLLLALAAAAGGGAHGEEISLTDPAILPVLFERPYQPIVAPLESYSFELPYEFLPSPYQNLTLTNLNGSEGYEVVIPENPSIPDLYFAQQLKRYEQFSLFIPLHRQIAAWLIELLVGLNTYEEFVIVSIYARSLLNPLLFSFVFAVAIVHRPDTQNQTLPNFACVNPGQYITGPVGLKLREQAAVLDEEQRAETPIEIPMAWTGTDLDMEHRVAYFREDIGINLFHWTWHIIYPPGGPSNVVNKDRRGELFFYLHQQIIARYNFERLNNKLNQVRRLLNWREPVEEAYFPKLDTVLSSRIWPARQAYTYIKDLARPVEQLFIDVEDLERWRERIFEAIHEQRIQNPNGSFTPLSERTGIDVLGNIIEASQLSPNSNYYGNMHNLGHVFLGYVHDPDHRYLESTGVMGVPATAMRDPVFYRLHSMVDDMFQEYKTIIRRYTTQDLGYPGINITSVEVRANQQEESNILITFWQQSDLDLSRGLDFFPRGPLFVRVTHLQHEPFTYTITVQNSGGERNGTVRIYMAPRQDERGLPFNLRQKRSLFIELDRFVVTLLPGDNIVVRNSSESSLTIPYERTFRNVDADLPNSANTNCACGWPQHMLLPKGAPEGTQADLFVMVSNYADDQVPLRNPDVCQDGSSFCGVRGELYPDRRAMGFPFDRPSAANSLQSFIQMGNGNMFSIGVTIRHRT